MNAVEKSVLGTIRGTSSRSKAACRYRVKVGDINVTTSASNEAEAVKRASQWHARHVQSLSKHGLRHVEYLNPAVTVR